MPGHSHRQQPGIPARLHCSLRRVSPGAEEEDQVSQLSVCLAGGMQMRHLIPPCSVAFSVQKALVGFSLVLKIFQAERNICF